MRIGFEVQAGRVRGFLISSCFVHVRKPDADIFRLALDIAQAPARQVVYIENTPMFVQVAEGWGFEAFSTRITRPRAQNWLVRIAE